VEELHHWKVLVECCDMGCDMGELYSLPLVLAVPLPFARHYIANIVLKRHLLQSMLLKPTFRGVFDSHF